MYFADAAEDGVGEFGSTGSDFAVGDVDGFIDGGMAWDGMHEDDLCGA